MNLMTIRMMQSADRERWDAFLDSAPLAHAYHRAGWAAVIQKSLGQQPCYMLSEDVSGSINGVLPLVRLQSRLFGHFIVSLPYLNYGGPCAVDGTVERHLIEEAVRFAREQRVQHLELRLTVGDGFGLRVKASKVSMQMPLPKDVDVLWKSFPSKLRNQINRPMKEGLIARVGEREELDAFHRVFSVNMRDLGTPVYAKRFFDHILREFPDSARICTVYHGRQPVASALIIGFRDRLEIPWASSLRTFSKLSPNMLLYWTVLKHAVESGYGVFDFGRSSRDSGTYRFKEQWGARPVPLYLALLAAEPDGASRAQSDEREVSPGDKRVAASPSRAHQADRAGNREEHSMRPARVLAPTAAPLGVADVILSALQASAPARAQVRLEEELKSYLGVEHLFFLSSGKAALTLTLRALHMLRRVRRVLIPAYTCYSVPAAVIRSGLEPVLVDVDPNTLDFEQTSLARALEHRDVLCVIPTHLFGIPADVTRVRALARPNVYVLEDAAQSFGLKTADGKHLGSIGDAAVFSLGRGKHLTCGGGGFLVTSRPDIARTCADVYSRLPHAGPLQSVRTWVELVLMSVFIDPHLYWFPTALPFLALGETVYDPDFIMSRLPTTGPGALRRWRSRLEQAHRDRAIVCAAWERELGQEAQRRRAEMPLLRFPVLMSSPEERTAVLEAARRHGLGVSSMYPSAVHRIPELRDRFRGQRFPGAERLAARLITLPTHRYVRPSDRATFLRIRAEIAAVPVGTTTQPAGASC